MNIDEYIEKIPKAWAETLDGKIAKVIWVDISEEGDHNILLENVGWINGDQIKEIRIQEPKIELKVGQIWVRDYEKSLLVRTIVSIGKNGKEVCVTSDNGLMLLSVECLKEFYTLNC